MVFDLEEQYDKLYRYCYYYTHQRELAEDITQEAFLRFFESTTGQNTGKSLHYLYTIARNLCIDEHRKRKRELLSEELPDQSPPDSCDSMDSRLVLQLLVRQAFAELDESDRELLLLRYVNEVPVSVISKLLGISRFALYRKLLRASRCLKEKLEKEELL